MVLDGGLTLGFIVGGGILSGVNALINIYKWITAPVQLSEQVLSFKKISFIMMQQILMLLIPTVLRLLNGKMICTLLLALVLLRHTRRY